MRVDLHLREGESPIVTWQLHPNVLRQLRADMLSMRICTCHVRVHGRACRGLEDVPRAKSARMEPGVCVAMDRIEAEGACEAVAVYKAGWYRTFATLSSVPCIWELITRRSWPRRAVLYTCRSALGSPVDMHTKIQRAQGVGGRTRPVGW